ncbi:hypothetical protein DYB34_010853 [Aphanomyces astaci]|uniref:chitinase n=1 Tax=Aphanomyces astaci TaxID=112090 RepID=A0A3R6WCD4_APHAT|nr:hypothetical protein DYB34_010853 [Aphanomyces astaci]
MKVASVVAAVVASSSASSVFRSSAGCPQAAAPRVAAHPLVGYWHNFKNPSGDTYPLSQIGASWDVINIAFAENAGEGKVGFTLDPKAGSEAQFITDIAALKAQGKTVALSLGGQDGYVSLGNAAETANFVSSVTALLTKYGFDGIDVDLESGVSAGLPIIQNLVTGVKQIAQNIGPSFYLSMAPEHPYVQGGAGAYGSIWGSYLPIIDGLRNELTQIHVQYYNNAGFMYPDGRQLKEGTVDCLVGGSLMLIEGFKTNYGKGWEFKGLRPDQVSFGVPSGPKSAGQGFVTADVVSRSLTCLTKGVGCDTISPKQPYPSYRGVMTWSINWDRFDGYAFSNAARQALDSLGGNVPPPPPPPPTSTTPTTTKSPVPTPPGPTDIPVTTKSPVTTPPPSPSCGTCTNCYYAPTQACYNGWTVAQCNSMAALTWCGN